MKLFGVVLLTGFLTVVAVQDSHAIVYGGVDFPDGASSFADAVISYDPLYSGGPGPTHSNFTNSGEAIGIPDYSGGNNGTGSVSLGDGGRIVLYFNDNSLTGSGDSAFDLWIFEVGSDVEDTFVDISKNGSTWHSVGGVGGSTSGIDIDNYGWTALDFFSFVRLTDDPNEGGQSGSTVGADIDAVGAITSAPPVDTHTVPEPATMALFGTGLAGAFIRRKFIG